VHSASSPPVRPSGGGTKPPPSFVLGVLRARAAQWAAR
jgi:hypothetical protein